MREDRFSNAGPGKFTQKACIAAVAIVGVLCLAVVRGVNGFPLTNDHSYFLPISLMLKATASLENPWLDPIAAGHFNWHGFVQPWLVGVLAPDASWHGVLGGLNALSVGVLFLVMLATASLGLGKIEQCSIAIIALALLLDMKSRPEVVAVALTVGLVWTLAANRRPLYMNIPVAAGLGVLFALLLCAHPAIFALSAIAFGGYALANAADEKARVASVAAFSAVTGLVFGAICIALILLVYRGSPLDWAEGIIAHSRITATRSDLPGIARYFVANRFVPMLGLGLLFLIPIFAGLLRLQNFGATGARIPQAIKYAILGVFLYALYRLAFRNPAAYYNFSGIIPALAIASAVVARNRSGLVVFTRGVAVVLAGFATLGTMIWLAQNIYDAKHITATSAALDSDIRQLIRQDKRICADAAVLDAVKDLSDALKIRVSVPHSDDELRPPRQSCDAYVRLQAEVYTTQPEEISEFRLTTNNYVVYPALLSWMRPLHFGYAIYE